MMNLYTSHYWSSHKHKTNRINKQVYGSDRTKREFWHIGLALYVLEKERSNLPLEIKCSYQEYENSREKLSTNPITTKKQCNRK